MRGKNPFEKEARYTLVIPPDSSTPEVDPPQSPRENPLEGLITGEDYEDLLVHAGRTGQRLAELEVQDALDDDRFEHLMGDEWQQLDDHEERLRAARAIARRAGARDEESHAEIKVEIFEESQKTKSRKGMFMTLLWAWTGLGALLTGAEGGLVGFFFGGALFFFTGVLGAWIVSLYRGMGSSSGRAV